MIRVFDEHGNEVNPTYPKRARGLVKQGRARYADDADDVIVLTSNIEEKVAYPSDIEHTSEDTEMFEYNVNEEINETAEVFEPIEEVEAVEPIEESGLPLNEELNRLYGILENVDRMLMNVCAMAPRLPDEMNGLDDDAVQAIAQTVSDESVRLRQLADRYTDMRTQTINLINRVKDDAKPQPEAQKVGFDIDAHIEGQLKMAMTESFKAMCQHLDGKLRRGVIELDEYRAEMETIRSEYEDRMKAFCAQIAE